MRIYKLIIAAFLMPQLSNAQVGTPATPPTAYTNTARVNYVRTWDAVAPEQDPNALMARPVKDVKQASQYLDGLGRPIQTVAKQASLITGTAITNDVVSSVIYDEFGRETYKYLPFVANNTGGNTSLNDGKFKTNPFQQQAGFYDNANPNNPIKGQGETFFYSQTDFEASPLNKPIKSFAQGNSWVGSKGTANERGITQEFFVNNTNDAVISWTIGNGITSTPSPSGGVGGGFYNAEELYKTVTTNEHYKQVVEFKDKEGKIILKKVQIANTVSDGYVGWYCTYYIHDDLGQLRFVLSPKATEAYLAGADLSTIADELCFKYEYDQRGRMIKKKVPGTGEVWMVYDARDRVVLTQDANMRTLQKWMYTLYDGLNRPAATGLITDPSNFNNHSFHLNNAYNSTNYPDVATYTSEELSANFYDDYSWLALYSIPLTNTYNTGYDSYFTTASNTVWPYPQANAQNNQLRGVATGSRIKVIPPSGGGGATYLYSVIFYDEKGRPIQTQSTNITGGVDITTTQYTWAGQPLVSVQKQDKQGTNPQAHIIITKIEYDDLGRVLNIRKAINSTINGTAINKAEQLIVQNEYDALGQAKKKILGAANLETLNHDYNIRGWMLGLNRDYAKDVSTTNYFGFDLGYDKANNGIIGGQTYANPQYNGNIEGMVWKSKGDGEKRKFDFAYDNANRLLKADFTQYTSGTFNQNAGVNYNVKMGDGIDYTKAYDANGNILQMQQWGWKMGGSVQIDNLKYTYTTNSNKLKSVVDFTNDATTKLGDFKTSTLHTQSTLKAALTPTSTQAQFDAIVDYSYDANGNVKKDLNKDIGTKFVDGITYNYLNLPETITVKKDASNNKGFITYTYTATGSKLKKQTTELAATVNYNSTNYTTDITTTTDYLGGMVYETKSYTNATVNTGLGYTQRLQFMGQEEGRVRLNYTNTTPTTYQYDYFVKDHLGNTRVVLTEEQQQDIYPAATLENVTYNGGTAVSTETQFYNIVTANIVTQATATGIPTYQNNNGITNNNPYSNTAANSARLYRLNATTNTVPNKTGLGIVLKVMAGDNINVFGKSYHKKPNAAGYTNTTNPLSIADVIGLFTGTSLITGKGVSTTQITGQSGFPTNVTTLLNNQTPQNPNLPRASINWIIFDEQFKYVSGGFDMVGTATNTTGTFKNHTPAAIAIPKNGYIYVYCSNESKYPVFFDNIQVVHNRSAILEENHFSVWGLRLEGISSKAAGKVENKYMYNGKELQSDFDISLYDYGARMYDIQLGRFCSIDPLSMAMTSWSPYSYVFDNPVRYVDPTGMNPEESTAEKPKELEEVVVTSSKKRSFHLSDHLAITKMDYKDGDSWFGSGLKFVGNVGVSLWNGVVGTVDAVLHPIETVEGIADGIENAYDYLSETPLDEILDDAGEALQDPHFWEDALAAVIAMKVIPSGGKKVGHHSNPKFMGGPVKQKLTMMRESSHKALHKDLNKYLVKQTNAAGKHMRPQRGNPGKLIQQRFSPAERLKAMSSFYKQNVFKYPGAAKDFFMQNPGQLLKF